MELSERKAAELRRKAGSLCAELLFWEGESVPGKPLEKHHTQIRRISACLAEAQTIAIQKVEAAIVPGSIVPEAQWLEGILLELHRIWGFFRRKLALRHVSWFIPYLSAADDLAWACYQPVRHGAAHAGMPDALKEPPLVFFSGEASPFAMVRGASYTAEEAEYGDSEVREFRELLRDLPIPVIGIPWYQIWHLPDALVIAHEAGHQVLHDLGLCGDFSRALAAALPAERGVVWGSWLDEIFADLFGVLSAGPAFVGTLLDFLATGPSDVEYERAGQVYPTVFLRALLAFGALRELGFRDAAEEAEQRWRRDYPRHALGEFEQDVPYVVRAIFETPLTSLGGKTLPGVHRFTLHDHASARDDATRILSERAPRCVDPRCLMAAARLAFEENPLQYEKVGAANRILHALEDTRSNGTRSENRALGIPESTRKVYDAAAGRRLFERLSEIVATSMGDDSIG